MTTAERTAAPLLPELPARRTDGPGQFAFADARHVSDILTAAGWTEVDVQPLDVVCTFPARELAFYATRLGPLGLFLQTADATLRSTVVEKVVAAFQPFVHGNEVRFDAACWDVRAVAR